MGTKLRLKLKGVLASTLAAIMLMTFLPVQTARAAIVPSGGVVTSATIVANDSSTYLMLTSTTQLTFSLVGYNRSTLSLRINGATQFPAAVNMQPNPIFASAQWAGDVLHLHLNRMDGFMGYFAFYDASGNLSIRFRNPPSSMSVARIVIDPGHGGGDRGAEGFRPDMPEAVINQHMSYFLHHELLRRGATNVLVLNTAPGMSLPERVRQAEAFNADIFISVHNNAARNPNTRGSEMFFYTPFSAVLAATASRNVSQNLNTINRGGRRARFVVTMSTQHLAILSEAGFVTNFAEYQQLITPHYQHAVAVALADAIETIVHHSYPGTGRVFS